MYDRRSIYALNKKNPDAIVLPDADGNLICLTCADFTDEAEFRHWKRWSDQDFHAEDKSDVEESDHTTSMDMVPEATLAVPNEEALAEERQVREDQIRCAEAAVSGIILCFIYLLNKQHLLAHLAEVDPTASNVLDVWCEEIEARAAVI